MDGAGTALRHYDSLFRDHSMVKVEKASRNVEGRLLAIFDVAEAWFSEEKDVNPNFCQACTAQASHQDMLARPVPSAQRGTKQEGAVECGCMLQDGGCFAALDCWSVRRYLTSYHYRIG
jgi:hypothetical protein